MALVKDLWLCLVADSLPCVYKRHCVTTVRQQSPKPETGHANPIPLRYFRQKCFAFDEPGKGETACHNRLEALTAIFVINYHPSATNC